MDKLRACILSLGLIVSGVLAQSFPSKVCAPYLESWGTASPATLATTTGNKYYTLAFIISNGTAPYWDGTMALSTNKYVTDIANLRAQGGDVIISFGGSAGIELAQACTSVSTLQAAYQQVITKYTLRWMDLDIEGASIADNASITRRNQALKNLQTANPGLRVSYTLPVMPDGLDRFGIALLSDAKTNGVRVDIVNVMAMDYGTCNIDMGQAAISAASSTKTQLATLGLTSKVGITPMLGVNDVACENFTLANAQAVLTYANANSYIGFLGFWAMGLDPNHSYLNIFKQFNSTSAVIAMAPVRGVSVQPATKVYDILGRIQAPSHKAFSARESIYLRGNGFILKIR
jgi:hypothetical protein